MMNRFSRRGFWRVALIGGICFAGAMRATAVTVSYWDPVSKQSKSASATVITAETSELGTGWYVVDSDVTRNDTVQVNGHANVILVKDKKWTIRTSVSSQGNNHPCIHLPSGDSRSLTIWGQSGGAGTLDAWTDSGYVAAIGGADRESGGTLTINGGNISATQSRTNATGAGIGGGGSASGGTVTINGGYVSAQGGHLSAGIGGNSSSFGGTVIVKGGVVRANGRGGAAGIGGGSFNPNTGTLTISGGSFLSDSLANPKNPAGQTIYRVELLFSNDTAATLAIKDAAGQDVDYGLTDVSIREKKLGFMLPNGTYVIQVTKGGQTYDYPIVVNNRGQSWRQIGEMLSEVSSGGTVNLEDGTYLPGSIPSTMSDLTLKAKNAQKVIVEAQYRADRCLMVDAERVTIEGLVFRHGCATGNGGGVCGNSSTTLKNCTISDCTASGDGGGVCGVGTVESCRISSCSAERGGGLYGVGKAFASLVTKCTATSAGAGAADTTAYSCTFGEGCTMSGTAAYDCLFYRSDWGSATVDHTYRVDAAAYFRDPATDDFRLGTLTEWELADIQGDPTRGQGYATSKTLDLDGNPLATNRNDILFFYAGCSSSVLPTPTLQELINRANPGETCYVPTGVYTRAVVPAEKAGIVLTPRETGGRIFLNGRGEGPCLTVEAENVRLDGFVFTNSANKAVVGNGAGLLISGKGCVVSNCTFAACAATQNGGAVFVPGVGSAEIKRSLFFSCTASHGGAVYQEKTARVRIEGCGFYDCRATTSGGAACADYKPNGLESLSILASLFVRCGSSGEQNCAVTIATCSNCTFVASASETQAKSVHIGNSYDCLFCRCTADGGVMSSCYDNVTEDYFVGGNYAIWAEKASACKGSEGRGEAFCANGTLGFDGRPLARKENGALVFVAGCCAPCSTEEMPTLQELINATRPGETCYVPEGAWTPATIDKPLTLRGHGPGKTVIDGGGSRRCLTLASENVTFLGLGLTAGYATNGGGIGGDRTFTGIVVSNCAFRACQATNAGGAINQIRGRVVDCHFVGNAAKNGGAVNTSDLIESCVFSNNTATAAGGAVASCRVRFSLFAGNGAGTSGGAASGTPMEALPFAGQYESCTFVDNTVGGRTESATSGVDGQGAVARDCLFYRCTSAATMANSFVAEKDPFVDCANGDYRYKPMTALELFAFSGDYDRGIAYEAAGILGLDGQSLTRWRNDAFFFFVGCYGTIPTDETLQEKINRTPVGGTLVLPSGIYTAARIEKTMTLACEDSAAVTIDGRGASPCLVIAANDVSVQGLVFTNGVAASGGAISASTAYTGAFISNCVFAACQATAVEAGGGALAQVRGLVTDCLFVDNTAIGSGGAAYACETLDHCVLSNNTASVGGALVDSTIRVSLLVNNAATTRGGAGAGTGSYYSCTFISNRARESTQEASSGIDGGTAYDCVFGNCFNGGKSDHSAVAAEAAFVNLAGGDYHLNTNNVFTFYALGGDQARAVTYQTDGVRDLEGNPIVSMRGLTRFFYVGCYRAVPAMKTLQEMIDDTPAGGVCDVPVGLYESAVISEGKDGLVLRGRGTTGTIVDAGGNGRCLLVKSKNVTVEGIAFRNGFAVESDLSGAGGGVLDSNSSQTLVILSCSFEACTAATKGGAVSSAKTVEGCRFTSCVSKTGGGVLEARTIKGCAFADCQATGDYGGAVRNTTTSGDWVIEDSSFVRCTAASSGGAIGATTGNGCESRVARCTFTSCSALGSNGGGVDNVCTVVDCVFDDCQAKTSGGGAANIQSSLKGCAFSNCSAKNGGGAQNVVKVEDCRFVSCQAELGGGLYPKSGCSVGASTFTGCRATIYGGGIYYGNSANRPTIENCTFTHCEAGKDGGGCDNVDRITDSSFVACSAKQGGGGGVHTASAILRCRFADCTVVGSGGAVNNVTELRSSLLIGNSATERGGGSSSSASYSCTYVQNRADAGDPAITAQSAKPRNCLFYGNSYAVENGTSCATAAANDFCDPTRGDYHLSLESYNLDALKGSANSTDKTALDLDGLALYRSVNGKDYFYVGCYAFSPVAAKENKVNIGDNKVHADSNLLVSLADLLPLVAQNPKTFADSNKRCVLTFADSLVKNDVVSINLVQSCLEVPACDGYRIVLQPPSGKRLVFNGAEAWRAIHVSPGATLEINDVEFNGCLANTVAASAAARTADGGAILNDGTLFVNRCVFRGNAASGGTKIYPAPSGNGGAIANRGTAFVTASSFAENEAANGAAICNSSTGRLTVVTSTFTANRAISGNSTVANNGGNGGAIAQLQANGAEPQTLLVNCTLTGNTAEGFGGAVYAQGDTTPSALALVNTIAVSNEGRSDLYLSPNVRGRMISTWYGDRTRPEPAEDAQWTDMEAEGEKGAVDLFANLDEAGASAVPTISDSKQVTFPLAQDLAPTVMWVRHDADWENVQVADSKSSATWTTVRAKGDLPPRQLAALPLLETDQLGETLVQPILGATSEVGVRVIGPARPEETDPRQIATLDETAIRSVFTSINLKPDDYARNGTVTVTFDASVTGGVVQVSSPLADLTGFTNVTLVVKGPIVLASSGACRFFTIGAGNRVVFEDVTFAYGNGSSSRLDGGGGALWGVHCNLTCTRCEFRDCTADYGGAICLDWGDCEATLTDCRLRGNVANVMSADIYNDPECRLRLYGCDLDPNGVEAGLWAQVVHAASADEAVADYFTRVADALDDLRNGDTLYLLNSEAEGLFDEQELLQKVDVTILRKYARVVNGVVKVEGGGTTLQNGLELLKSGDKARLIEISPGRYAPIEIPKGLDQLVLVGTDLQSCVIDGTLGSGSERCVNVLSSGVILSNLTFQSGAAVGDGGGVKGARSVVGCHFKDCSATGAGGGVAGDGSTEVLLSLFTDCTAATGSAVSGVTALNCTFASTTETAVKIDANSVLQGCLTVRCSAENGMETYSVADPATEFAQQNGTYALRSAAAARYPADGNFERANEEAWRDLFGNEMLLTIAGTTRLFAGAFAPLPPDQTLQQMIDAAAPDAILEIPAGTYGPATIPAAKGALVLKPVAGARVTVNALGYGPALTVAGAATIEGLTITGGVAEKGGGVFGSGSATVRSCLFVGNRATVAGGGVSGVTVENCTFVGNTAPAGAAAADSQIRASLGVGADQTLEACASTMDWLTAATTDVADFANGDYSILEANWARFRAMNTAYGKSAYETGRVDIDGRLLARRIAGDYVYLVGAFALEADDTLQRLIDFSETDTIEVPDGAYTPFVVARDNLTIRHAGEPAACLIEGAGCWRGAMVTNANITLVGMTFRNCAAGAGDGGGVGGVAASGLTVSNCVFDACTAQNGGAVAGVSRLENCLFTGNTADACGGAVLSTNASAVITGCSFAQNVATNNNGSGGGAIYAAHALIAGCFFTDNEAACAGAVFAETDVTTICSTFVGNRSRGGSFATTASAAYSYEADQPLVDCVLAADTQTGFVLAGCVITNVANPFVSASTGDWRLRDEFLTKAVDFGEAAAARISLLTDERAVMPGGDSLVTTVLDEPALFAGAYGLFADSTLQDLVDQAGPGDTLSIPAGAYLPAVIPAGKDGLTIAGAAGDVVIDGCGLFRCLTVRSAGVTLKGLTFANGKTDASGGGVWGENVVDAVIDCTFTNCTAATNGGGIDGVTEIRGCRFFANRAGAIGGGASQSVRDVIGSVFAFNAAGTADAASAGTGGRLDHCTFYANTNGANAVDIPTGSFNLTDADAALLVDPAHGDFHLRPEDALSVALTDFVEVTNALAQGWIGAEGTVLAQAAGDWAVMTRGAFNGWEMTLQSAVDHATMGDVIEVPGGVYPPLFVGAAKMRLTVRAKPGETVLIQGAGFRAVTDASQALTLEGLVITNGTATSYGEWSLNGGGYCGVPGNGATLVGCTVVGCAAPAGEAQGGGIYGADEVVSSKVIENTASFGGGIAGTALVRTSLIARNRATGTPGGFGGGIYGRIDAATVSTVKNCTLIDNQADQGADNAGLYEGTDTYSIFYGCGRNNTAANPTGIVVSDSPFVNLAAGDYRIAYGNLSKMVIVDQSYAAAAAQAKWLSPDGDQLVLSVVGRDLLAFGAYGTDLDLSLQRQIDAAQPGETIHVSPGVYAPVTVKVGNIRITGDDPQACIIDGANLYRGITVEKSGVTIDGLTVRHGDLTPWARTGIDCTGGAIRGFDPTTVASNCTFALCRAVKGGATAQMGLVSGCSYLSCTASDCGGGSFGDTLVRASLFQANAAATNGAAAASSTLTSCTFAKNTVAEAGGVTVKNGTVDYSVFYLNVAGSGTGNLTTNESFFVANSWVPTNEAAASNRITRAEYVQSAIGWTGPDGKPLVMTLDGERVMSVGAFAPLSVTTLPPVANQASFSIQRVTGGQVLCTSSAEVVAALEAGDRVDVVAVAENEATEGVEAAIMRLQAQFVAAAQEVVKDMPWYSVEAEGMGVSVVLNEQAEPTLDESSEVDLTGRATEVAVVPSNVKPNLWYGLGRSGTLTGEYVVEKWVQADAAGRLPASLTASKEGACGYYKVLVTDRQP